MKTPLLGLGIVILLSTGISCVTGRLDGLSEKETVALISTENPKRRAAIESYGIGETSIQQVLDDFGGPALEGLLGIVLRCWKDQDNESTQVIVIGLFDDQGLGVVQYPDVGSFWDLTALEFEGDTLSRQYTPGSPPCRIR